jgi:hypothetical protein
MFKVKINNILLFNRIKTNRQDFRNNNVNLIGIITEIDESLIENKFFLY